MPANPFSPPDAPVADVALPADEAELAFELGYGDLLRFYWMHQLTSPSMQLVFVGLSVLLFGADVRYGGLVPTLVNMTLAYVVFWALQLGAITLKVLAGRNRTLRTRHVVRLGPDALRVRTRHVEATWFWTGVLRVTARPGFVAVYQSQSVAQIVPNRAFGHRVQRDEFVRYARERVAAAAGD
jgi:hypothetical protein